MRLSFAVRVIAILIGLVATSGSARADDAAPHFTVSRYVVDGNSLIPAADVAALLVPFTGPSSDFSTVQDATEALVALFRDRGFALVRVVVPEQELADGVVHLRVVETTIGAVKVQDNQHFSDENIRASVPALVPGKVPDMRDLSAQLKLANANPAKQTTVQMQSGDRDDQVDAVLKVTDRAPWTVGAGFDNTGDRQTGRDHMTVHYENADIGGWDHVLSLQYTTSVENPRSIGVYALGYHVPIYDWADSVDFYASYSDVNAGTVSAGLLDLTVSGKGSVAGLRYNHALPRLGDYESQLVLGLDYKAFENEIGYNGAPLGNDVTVHPVTLTYSGNSPLAGGTVNAYASVSRNIPGGSHGDSGAFGVTRSGAPADYTVFRYGASYFLSLPGDLQARVQVNGQESGDALIPGEQFGAGGSASVRGFDEREFSNDRGRTFNAELYSPEFCGSKDMQCRVLGFYDTARLSRNDALPGEETHEDIASIGAGARFTLEDCQAQLDYGYVLQGMDSSPRGSSQIHFRVMLNY